MAHPRLGILLLATLGTTHAIAQSAVYTSVATAPGPASHFVWDSGRSRVVAIESTPAAGLWDWDGNLWSRRFGTPDPGTGAPFAVAYDAPRRVVLALSGTHAREWDGARWTVQPAPLPAGVSLPQQYAYDSHRRRVVAIQGAYVVEWDGAQWSAQAQATGPGTRNGPAIAFDPIRQRTVLYGGNRAGQAMADCWAWDGSAWTLLGANLPPGPRESASLGCEPTTGRLVLYGGDPAVSTTWTLLGTTWSQAPTTRDPGPRLAAKFVWDGTGLLLNVGQGTRSGTLWRFQNQDWSVLAGGSPIARRDAAFAWDRARGEAVLFGGLVGNLTSGGTAFDDTWTYDGRWHQRTAAVRPPAWIGAGFVWSTPDNALLLFGGTPAPGGTATTWLWNGSQWQPRFPATSPPPRTGMVLAEDPAGGVLLFGGQGGITILGDQWHWDGVNWQPQLPATMPSPRTFALGVLDPLRNVVVMAGGYDTTTLPETWEWNGTTWAARSAAPFQPGSPNERIGFRPDTGRVFVESYGQWEWDGTTWTTTATSAFAESGARVVGDLARQRLLRFPFQNLGLAVFTPTPATAQRYGNGCALGPAPGITTIGRPTPGETGFALAAATLAPGAPTILAVGLAAASTPLGSGCSLLTGQLVATHVGLADASGTLRYDVPLPPDNQLRGLVLHAQVAVVDPPRSLFGGVTVSDGLRITLGD